MFSISLWMVHHEIRGAHQSAAAKRVFNIYRSAILPATSMESPKTLPVRLGWRLPHMLTLRLTSASIIPWFPHVRQPICSYIPPLIIPPNRANSLDAVMNPTRHIELDIDIGADARDWSAIQAQEKLKPVELELRRVEEMVGEIVTEMDYLRMREQKLRDTNESTNERVKWFAFGTMGMLVGLGAWQVIYLRAYFRWVYLPFALLLSFHEKNNIDFNWCVGQSI